MSLKFWLGLLAFAGGSLVAGGRTLKGCFDAILWGRLVWILKKLSFCKESLFRRECLFDFVNRAALKLKACVVEGLWHDMLITGKEEHTAVTRTKEACNYRDLWERTVLVDAV